MSPHIVTIRGTLGWRTLPFLIQQFQGCIAASAREFILDLSRLGFCHPTGLICLAAGVLHLKRKGYGLVNIREPLEEPVGRYLARIEFYSAIDKPNTLNVNRLDATGRFVELLHLSSASECMPATTKIVEVISNNIAIDDVGRRAVDFILSELTENIFHHALSPLGGFICCQSYPKENVVRVAIVHLGVGIEPALRENPETATILEEIGPLRAALTARITGRPGFNSGLGLFWSSKIIESNEGRVGIHSTCHRLEQNGGSISVESAPWWPGTVIHLKLRCDKPLNHQLIFERYAPAENDYQFLDADPK